MEINIFQFEVHTDENGLIFISQAEFGHDDSEICIHPKQIDLLIECLKEAKKELQG